MPVIGISDADADADADAYASDDAPETPVSRSPPPSRLRSSLDEDGDDEDAGGGGRGGGRRVDDSLAALANETTLTSEPAPRPPPRPRPRSAAGYASDDDDDDDGGGGWDDLRPSSPSGPEEGDDYDGMRAGFEEFVDAQNDEQQQREHVMQLLSDLDDLKARGFAMPKHFNHTSDPAEMEHVLRLGQESMKRRTGTAISKKLLTGFVGVVELVNHSYDPFGAKLDGFGDNVTNSIDDYEDVLYRLWQRYGQQFGEQHPLIELFVMLGLTAAQTHMMNAWADKHIAQQTAEAQKAPPPPPTAQSSQSSHAAAPPPAATPVSMIPGMSLGDMGNILAQSHARGAQEVVPFPGPAPGPARRVPGAPDATDTLDAALAGAQDEADAIQIQIPPPARSRARAASSAGAGARRVRLAGNN